MNSALIVTIVKGLWIGGTMTVPGVSGGSMAMMLGIYDRLITSVSSFFKNPRGNLRFLAAFGLGAAAGMMLFSRLILFLLTTGGNMPLRFFFLGAVAGSIPMIYRKADVSRLDVAAVVYPGIGIMTVVLLSLLPSGVFVPGEGLGLKQILFQMAGGMLLSVGLVLPGISVSQMLYMLGIYEGMVKNLSALRIPPLIPLGMGALAGILLTTRILERCIRQYPQPTYLIIFGFILGSLPELVPGIPMGGELVYSLMAAMAGFGVLSATGQGEGSVL